MKTKTRLTITLSHDLLDKVDRLIDGNTIRNRSHAIESLVRQGVSTQLMSAVILAGGKTPSGEIPSLKKINNRFVLALTLEHLKSFGITQVIICAGQNESLIKKEFADGSRLGLSIHYVNEKKPLGTAGAIKNAQQYLSDDSFLVLNDSTVTNLNLHDLFEFHSREGSMATICVKPRMSEQKYGQAFLHGNKIVKFLDTSQEAGISIVNVGLYVMNTQIFDLIQTGIFSNLETDVFPKLAAQKELSAFVFQGSWYDVSLENSYQEAVASLSYKKLESTS